MRYLLVTLLLDVLNTCNMLYIKVGDFNGYIPVSGDFNDKMSNAILHCDCIDGNSSLQRD